MALRIEHFIEPAAGVAIERDGAAKPAMVIPFPGEQFHRAEALDDDTVLFIGGTVEPELRFNTLLLAVYDLRSGRFTRRAEIAGVTGFHHRLSRDRSRLIVGGAGIAVVDIPGLTLRKNYECYRLEGTAGRAAAYSDWSGGYSDARDAGWSHVSISYDYQLGETDDGRLVFVEMTFSHSPPIGSPLVQEALTIDVGTDEVQPRCLLRADGADPLGRIDPRASLAYVNSRQVAIYRAFAPSPSILSAEGVWRPDEARSESSSDEVRYGLALHLWHLADADARPVTVVVRSEPAAQWKLGLAARNWWPPDDQARREGALKMLDDPRSGACAEDDARWSMAAQALLLRIDEDPRDGRLWLAFADDCLRSLDIDRRLGPLIRLGGAPGRTGGPSLAVEGDGTVVVRRSLTYESAHYRFGSRQFDGVVGPVTIEPLVTDVEPQRHEKAFAAFAKRQTRRRFTVPDWTREACAAALTKQATILRKGFGDMVVASTGRLNFTYKVGKSTLDEAAFFAGLVDRDVPVGPELRALLRAYLDALGADGEGEQPWEEPDEAVGALGSALRALALLDPGSLDLLRAYLEARDGEHEGYAIDVVVPAYFERHGWRSAEAVRFGIYATLNRFWGGRRPARGFDGLSRAMAAFCTPEEVAEAVRREAEAFGRKPDWGYGAGDYWAAFRSLLDPSAPFEAAVLDALQEGGAPS